MCWGVRSSALCCEAIRVAVCISHVDVGISDALSMKRRWSRGVTNINLYPGSVGLLTNTTTFSSLLHMSGICSSSPTSTFRGAKLSAAHLGMCRRGVANDCHLQARTVNMSAALEAIGYQLHFYFIFSFLCQWLECSQEL